MKNIKLWDWLKWNQRLMWKIFSILCHQKKIFFSCVCIKCFKSAKKNTKMWSWNYWQRNRKDLEVEVESDLANWAQIFDKCDPKKQKYRHELMPNTKFQQCRVIVWNDLVERKIKSCRKSSKRF